MPLPPEWDGAPEEGLCPDEDFQVREEEPPEWEAPSSESEAPPPAVAKEDLPPVPLLIPEWAAAGGFCQLSPKRARRELKAALVVLRFAEALVARRIGEGLRRIKDGRIDPMRIGEFTFPTFANHWLGMSENHASDLTLLSEALDRMPHLSAAYDTGVLGRCQVQELRKVIEPETEVSWVRLAAGIPVHKLRRVVEIYRRKVQGIPPEEETVEVTIQAPAQDIQYLWIHGKEMVEKVVGHGVSRAQVLEWLCAEFVSKWPEVLGESKRQGTARPWEETAPPAEPVPELPPADEEELPEADPPPCPLPTIPDPSEAKGIEALLDVLLELMALKQALDWQAGRVLNWCRKLGIPFNAAEVLGVSTGWASELRAVDQGTEFLPRMREAYISGRLGWNKVKLLLLISCPNTQEAWIKEAGELTLLGLKREIEAMLGMRQINPVHWRRRTLGLPPDEQLLRELGILPGGHRHADWRAILAASNVRWLELDEEGAVGPGGIRTSPLRAPPHVADTFWAVLAALMKALRTVDQGRCIRVLVDYYSAVHEAEHEALGTRRPIQERDRHLCQFPNCTNRVTHAHHIEFESQGGSDEPSNLVSLCEGHHLIAGHLGMVKIWGKAPDEIYFQIGPRILRDNRLVAVLAEDGETWIWKDDVGS